MNKRLKALIATAAAAILVAALYSASIGSDEKLATVTLYPENSGPIKVKAEIADSPEEITTGLMFRESLPKNRGMLFVFPDSATRNFWMKNMLIPLDMLFISENMTIAKVHHAVPCVSEPCPLYNSERPVKYVLEVNGNFTGNAGIREGGKIKLA